MPSVTGQVLHTKCYMPHRCEDSLTHWHPAHRAIHWLSHSPQRNTLTEQHTFTRNNFSSSDTSKHNDNHNHHEEHIGGKTKSLINMSQRVIWILHPPMNWTSLILSQNYLFKYPPITNLLQRFFESLQSTPICLVESVLPKVGLDLAGELCWFSSFT